MVVQRKATRRDQPADDIKAFLISDAEGRFNQVLTKPWRFKFALPRNVRATDVLMRRASTLNWKFLTGLSDLGLTLIRIPGSSVDSACAEELELAQAIRTDLDRFSNLEQLLIKAPSPRFSSQFIDHIDQA